MFGDCSAVQRRLKNEARNADARTHAGASWCNRRCASLSWGRESRESGRANERAGGTITFRYDGGR